MAFTNEKLSNVVQVTSGNTSTIATVSSSKKVYIRSIMAYDVDGSAATASERLWLATFLLVCRPFR